MRKKPTLNLRTILINSALCFLALAFTVSVQAQSRTGNSRSGSSNSVGWQRYELGKGTFSVLLPGKPVEEVRTAPPGLGISAQMYLYAVSTEKGAYLAQYGLLGEAAEKWSENTREIYYNGIWNGLAKGLDSQMERRNKPDRTVLIEKRRTKFSGHDGYELTFTVGEIKGRALLALVGRHGFAAMTLGTAVMTNADRERFFKSFTIKVSPAGPAKL